MTACFKQKLLVCLVALFPLTAFGGQSLVLTSGNPGLGLTDPIYPQSQSWRIEFALSNWTLPPAGITSSQIFSFYGLGGTAYLFPDGSVALQGRDPVIEQEPCYVSLTGRTNVQIRLQKNVTAMTLTCEIWNSDGTGYASQTNHIQSLVPASYGGGVVGYNVTASLAFLRIFTTTVPLGAQSPTTADAGDYTELKFDGTMADSSGNGHSATGAANYIRTPTTPPVAYLKAAGSPWWTSWVSLRAGFPAQLDGTASFSMADASSKVSYYWTQAAGSTKVIWSDQTAATPTITGLVFGSYSFSLAVTDIAGNTAKSTLTVGAVATDSNGVIVNANPAADAIFGPMIAYGKNPWGWADARNWAMEKFETNTYATAPTWSAPAETAKVKYTFFDPFATAPQGLTSLVVGISPQDLSITVANASALDLSSLPTEVLVGAQASWEIVRICGAAGNTLTACYDGRGFHYGRDNSYIQPAMAWNAGAGIWQSKVQGNGTHFLTTMCSGGPGWTVGSRYPITSSGTVTVKPGSVAATGIGTTWNGTQNSLAIELYATHSGTPFSFFAYVVSANGTSLTLSRPYPADADTGSYSYRIFSDQRSVVLHYARSDATDGYIYFPTAGCESDTALYLYMGWDNGYGNQSVAASSYSYIDANYVSDFSPNYYDLGLAHYAFYFRSGYTPSLTAARNIEDYWIRYPENAQGDAGGNPRDKSLLGVFAAAVLDGDRASNWSGLRTYAQSGIATAQANNCDDDTRETAYQMAWLALAGEFDPNPTQRAKWQSGVATAYQRDNGCKGQDNSFATGFYWNPAYYPQVSLTQGSAIATPAIASLAPAKAPAAYGASQCSGSAWGVENSGRAGLGDLTGSFSAGPSRKCSGVYSNPAVYPQTVASQSAGKTATGAPTFPASMCSGTVWGTALATNGKAGLTALTGSFVIPNGPSQIVVGGMRGGVRYDMSAQFDFDSASSIELSGLWPGDTGTVYWMIANNSLSVPNVATIATGTTDPNFGQIFSCALTDSTHMTLHRPWPGASGTYGFTSYNLVGVGSQPFMVGIKTLQMRYAGQVFTPYQSLAAAAANWVGTTGFDVSSKGLYYGRGFPVCEPATVDSGITDVLYLNPNCMENSFNTYAVPQARARNSEAQNAMTVMYLANPSSSNQALGDQFYGAIFGAPGYTASGYWSDGVTASNLDDVSLSSYKWPGFFFGVGMAHQWPAVRLGGVAPAKPRTVSLSFAPNAAAAAVQIMIIAPSGALAHFQCGLVSPCNVTVDDRQGSHWSQVQYLSKSGVVTSVLPVVLLPVAGGN